MQRFWLDLAWILCWVLGYELSPLFLFFALGSEHALQIGMCAVFVLISVFVQIVNAVFYDAALEASRNSEFPVAPVVNDAEKTGDSAIFVEEAQK
jgi:hypothetical protein